MLMKVNRDSAPSKSNFKKLAGIFKCDYMLPENDPREGQQKTIEKNVLILTTDERRVQ